MDLNNPLHLALLEQQGQLSHTDNTSNIHRALEQNRLSHTDNTSNIPLRQELESHVNDEVEYRLYGDNTIYVYNKLTKKVTSKPNDDTNPLRYLSPYPPSFGNMSRYLMYKIPLGGTKRKRKRRTKRRK